MKQGHEKRESTKRKLLITFAVVALMAGLGVLVTSAAFTATTDNQNNRIEAGSVALSDTDAGTGVLYSQLDVKPGSGNGPTSKCIRVNYSGSLASTVKLYRSAVTNGSSFHLTIERAYPTHGTPLSAPAANMNCTSFVAGSTVYNGTLAGLGTDFTTGTAAKDGANTWASGDAVDYKFTIYVVDDNPANAHTSDQDSGLHSFTWEAQNN
jgi:hypothetical protein